MVRAVCVCALFGTQGRGSGFCAAAAKHGSVARVLKHARIRLRQKKIAAPFRAGDRGRRGGRWPRVAR